MAELILSSVLDSITGQIGSLVAKEFGLALGVKGELEKLRGTVSAICALLHDAERMRDLSDVQKDWLKKLEDVVYDADDLLDDFSTEVQRRHTGHGRGQRILNEVGSFFSSSNQLINPFKMAHGVKKIRKRIDAIHRDKVQFQLEGNSRSSALGGSAEIMNRRETSAYQRELYGAIGRDEDKKIVIEFLLDPDFDEENVSILSVVGFGGLGKTTLARFVFNDERVKEHFELTLWVCVSTNFNVDDILKKILKQCTPSERHGDRDVDELHRKIGEQLNGKKFLLVLDDVWNENHLEWIKLKGFLMNGAKGSKILVTTRTPGVAGIMSPKIHTLSGLREEESLSLLMRLTMKKENEWKNKNLETIAKEILKKCAGVPLAIMTIGGLLLCSGNTEEHWLEFKNSDFSKIDQKEGDIMPSLRLSYDFLPSHLKQCFAYCSLFPEDCDLDPSLLIHLWMANGFIKPLDPERAPEEVGQAYFTELVQRYFFQDIEHNAYGNITGCKMHDLMHELARFVAGDNCIEGSRAPHVGQVKARHVSMDLENFKLKRFVGVKRIRTLLLATDYWTEVANPRLDVSCFRNLRALRVCSEKLKKIPNSIGELKHLRSLDLSGCYGLEELPVSISKLCNLEVLHLRECLSLKVLPRGITKLVNLRHLDLRECYNLKVLPRGITKLVNLRHLDVSGCTELRHMPKGIGRMTSLQMLPEFVVGEEGNRDAASWSELRGLTRLKNKELGIRGLNRFSNELLDDSLLIDKFALQSLELVWDRDTSSNKKDEQVLERLRPNRDLRGLKIEWYGGAALPSWFSQMHELIEIEMSECNGCMHLPPLDQLPSLKRIDLSWMGSLEYIELSDSSTTSGVHQSFFPCLEEIQLWNLPKFRGWERRRDNAVGIEEEIIKEEEEEEDSSLTMSIPTFSHKVKVTIEHCPKFSYAEGQDRHVSLNSTTCKRLIEMTKLRSGKRVDEAPPPLIPSTLPNHSTMMMMLISPSHLPALTSLSLGDAEYFPVDLFRSLPSLMSLDIFDCPRLKALPMRAIFQYCAVLESLKIQDCGDLDLSLYDNDDNGDEGNDDTQHLQLCHTTLRHLHIKKIPKMESLPEWIQRLPNLRKLHIDRCDGLKSIPGRVILQLLISLETLWIDSCKELDLSPTDSEDEEDMQESIKSCRPANKLRNLFFQAIPKMKTLPWWIRHLTNLEDLSFWNCESLQALPEWFPQHLTSLTSLTIQSCGELSRRCKRDIGEDRPKISHISNVYIR